MERVGSAHCPLCRDGFGEGGETHTCPACATVYHLDCTAELGGCSTMGCELRGKRPQQLSHWACRVCHQPITNDLTRRGCRCSASLHEPCVGAHAEVCQHGSELQATGRRRPATRGGLLATRC